MPVCATCLNEIRPPASEACGRCGHALAAPLDEGSRICLHCLAHPAEYDGAVCAAAYEGRGRELIHLLKFRGVRTAAEYWAQRLAALTSELPETPELVTPVPLGKKRQRERGFNQSSEIARRLAKKIDCRYEPHALERQRETRPQSELPLADRQRNLQHAFAADRQRVAGRSVLLVDDVLTTGATARAAAQALCAAGARRVMLATAARADLHQAAPRLKEAVA